MAVMSSARQVLCGSPVKVMEVGEWQSLNRRQEDQAPSPSICTVVVIVVFPDEKVTVIRSIGGGLCVCRRKDECVNVMLSSRRQYLPCVRSSLHAHKGIVTIVVLDFLDFASYDAAHMDVGHALPECGFYHVLLKYYL